ncbi:MAG: SRPBCC family protein [Bacteroidota bacterium]
MAHTLKVTTVINKPIEEVFDFFSKAGNLNVITPPGLQFVITSPLPITMEAGCLIDYRIKLFGISFKWKTLISVWQPPFRFVDEQLKGPYVKWHHTHEFRALENETTQMTDTVVFQSPGWILEPLVHYLFVNKRVKQIFSYRGQKLKEIFG